MLDAACAGSIVFGVEVLVAVHAVSDIRFDLGGLCQALHTQAAGAIIHTSGKTPFKTNASSVGLSIPFRALLSFSTVSWFCRRSVNAGFIAAPDCVTLCLREDVLLVDIVSFGLCLKGEGGRVVLRRQEQAELITSEERLELHHRWVIGQSAVCWRTDPFVVIVE